MQQTINNELLSHLETIQKVIVSIQDKVESASKLAVETLKMEIKSYFVGMVEVQQMHNILLLN